MDQSPQTCSQLRVIFTDKTTNTCRGTTTCSSLVVGILQWQQWLRIWWGWQLPCPGQDALGTAVSSSAHGVSHCVLAFSVHVLSSLSASALWPQQRCGDRPPAWDWPTARSSGALGPVAEMPSGTRHSCRASSLAPGSGRRGTRWRCRERLPDFGQDGTRYWSPTDSASSPVKWGE